jgi:MYXO-CTERM domain-containing protein
VPGSWTPCLLTCLAALLLLRAPDAYASVSYPAALDEKLALSAEPPCTLCHESATGGMGTATTPFARSLRELGLRGRGDESSLYDALDASVAAGLDSDEDGLEDVEELMSGSSPNLAGEEPSNPPAAGCTVAPPDANSTPWGWIAAALAAVMRRRVTSPP